MHVEYHSTRDPGVKIKFVNFFPGRWVNITVEAGGVTFEGEVIRLDEAKAKMDTLDKLVSQGLGWESFDVAQMRDYDNRVRTLYVERNPK